LESFSVVFVKFSVSKLDYVVQLTLFISVCVF